MKVETDLASPYRGILEVVSNGNMIYMPVSLRALSAFHIKVYYVLLLACTHL